MSRPKRIPEATREEILRRIKELGEPTQQVATEHGVSPKTVYAWLGKTTEKSGVSWPEHNRFRSIFSHKKAISIPKALRQ